MFAFWRWPSFCSVFLLAAAAGFTPVGASNVDSETETAIKIDVSGRQRMLTQRLSAATCLAMAGIDAAHRIKVAKASWNDFNVALDGLANGNVDLGLTPSSDPDVLAAIDNVDVLWKSFGPSVQQILAGDVQSVTINAIVLQNVPLLKASNVVVQALIRESRNGSIDNGLAGTIDVAGRQRMLSQKMMKEACFIAVGLNIKDTQAALQQSMDLFEASLIKLSQGDAEAGIVAPTSRELEVQYAKVRSLWKDYSEGLNAVLKSEGRLDFLADLGLQSDALLAASHKAVQMYVD